jgi:hypothetical protein
VRTLYHRDSVLHEQRRTCLLAGCLPLSYVKAGSEFKVVTLQTCCTRDRLEITRTRSFSNKYIWHSRLNDLHHTDSEQQTILDAAGVEYSATFELLPTGTPDASMVQFARLAVLGGQDAFLLEAVFRDEVSVLNCVSHVTFCAFTLVLSEHVQMYLWCNITDSCVTNPRLCVTLCSTQAA